jgi:Restriction endonuclease
MTKKEFQNLKEDRLVDEVLIPLFRKMGYKDVYKYHGGSGELGKDIVFWDEDRTGARTNYVVVVKAVKLSGKAQAAEEVAGQVRQAFGSAYIEPVTLKNAKAQRCFVVTNKDIPKEGKQAIRGNLGDTYPYLDYLEFWDGDKVWELATKHLFSIPDKLDALGKDLANLHLDWFPEVTISGKERRLRFLPKSDKANPSDLGIGKANFVFPKNDSTLEIIQKMQYFIDHGGQVEIPKQYIAEFTEPAIIEKLFGKHEGIPDLVTMLSEKKDRVSPFKLELLKDGLVFFSLDYMGFKWLQGGRESFTLSNEDQKTFYTIKMRLFSNSKVNLDIDFHTYGLSANMIKKSYALIKAFQEASLVRVIWLEKDSILFEHQNTMKLPEVNKGYLEYVDLLSEIENKAGVTIIVPDRDFSREDMISIKQFSHIVLYGGFQDKWCGPYTLPLDQVDVASVQEALASIGNEGQSKLLLKSEGAKWRIFDTEIDLGPTEHIFSSVRLVNQDELEKWLDKKDFAEPISIIIEPGDDNTVIHQYPKFSPENSK